MPSMLQWNGIFLVIFLWIYRFTRSKMSLPPHPLTSSLPLSLCKILHMYVAQNAKWNGKLPCRKERKSHCCLMFPRDFFFFKLSWKFCCRPSGSPARGQCTYRHRPGWCWDERGHTKAWLHEDLSSRKVGGCPGRSSGAQCSPRDFA